jgi:peptidoglycan/LPS O-acetylase OafA/YrhL
MPRQRLDQVDAMRPMKQAGVISTHVLTYFVPAAAIVSTNAVMLLTHFSREGFFFISACMLTYAYMDLDSGGLRRFYGRRFLAVAVPYLCWSVIYFLYLLPTAHYPSAPAALRNFAVEIATGYYQLYFLLIILQYYLVFPLLAMFLRRTRAHHGTIVVTAALGHVALMTLMHWSVFPVLRAGWIREFTPYAFYLVAGSIAAFHLETVNDWLLRHVRLVLALTAAAALFAEGVYFLAAYGVTSVLGSGNDPFQPSVIPFDLGAIACLYLLGVTLVKPGRSPRLRAAVRIGSDNSYGVYLTQMLFINALIWVGWAKLDTVVWWPLLCTATVVIVFLAGVALTSLLARTPLAVPLTGRQRQPWARSRIQPLDHDDELLPGVKPALKAAVCLGDVVESEHLVDGRPQCTQAHTRLEEGRHAPHRHRIQSVLETRIAEDRERSAAREGRGSRVQEARDDQCRAGAGRIHEILLAGTSDHVEDDVGASPAGVAADGFGHIRLVGGDDRRRASGEQVILLRRAPGDSDGHGADLIGDLHRRPADTAGRGGDEDMVAGPHPRLLDERAVGGGVRDPDRRCLCAPEPGRAGDDPARGHRGVLGVAAADARVRDGRENDRIADL